jgi:hypothetical protein
MGYRISWLAVDGIDKQAVYERLELGPTGETGLAFDHPTTGRQLENGWTVVGFDELGHELVDEKSMKRLSVDWTVLACNYCETTMCSTVHLWKKGEEVWSVWHFSNDTVDDLAAGGDLPEEFDAIEQKYRALQAEEAADARVDHMIEIPIALAAHMTSFRHDEGPDDFDYLEFKPRAEKSKAKAR